MALAESTPLASALPQLQRPQQRRLTTPRLSVVIVNYHRWENTAGLVRQLLASRTMCRDEGEVVVVDNHSPAHPAARRLRRCPGVSLRRWGRNRGFARAVNEGCRLSQGEWILLLNPDMSLPEGFLDQVQALCERATAEMPGAGILGLGLRNYDGSRQLSAGAFPSLRSTLSGLFLPRSRRKYRAVSEMKHTRVDWVTGCGMLIRRECLQQLRGLDPAFFLYYEDVDLCRRAASAGWEVWYVPEIEAIHHHPLHLREVTPALRIVTRHSLLTYARKHWPRWQFQILTAVVCAEASARRLWAHLRGQHDARGLFGMLARLAHDLGRDRDDAARQCLDQLTGTRSFYER